MAHDHCGWLTRLRDCGEGNVFPLTAAAIVVLAGLVGGGVDMSRAYLIENRLQNACDAGVLAGRKNVTVNGFDTKAQNAAQNYFKVNLAGVNNTTTPVFATTSADNGNVINGVASTTTSTTIMTLFGYDTMPIQVDCSASMAMGNADVMMVLDTTGSMDWAIGGSGSQRRINALRDSMKNFYDSLATAMQGTNARVRYGFVPYNQTVNVGKLLYSANPSWIADTNLMQSKEAQYIDVEKDTDEVESYEPPVYKNETSVGEFSNSSWVDHQGSWRKDKDCDDDRPDNTSWSNNGGSSSETRTYFDGSDNRITETVQTQPQSRTVYQCYKKSNKNFWVEKRTEFRERYSISTAVEEPVYKKIIVREFDRYKYKQMPISTSLYKTGASVSTVTGNDGADEYSTWAGCIEERSTVASDSISYSSILGFTPSGLHDLDIDSAPSSDETKWRALWPEMAYIRTTSDGRNVTSSSTSDYGDPVGAVCPTSSQLFASMDKSTFYDYADSLSPNGSTYHSIGMIWGARLASPQGIFASNVNEAPANGGEVSRHIIFMTDGEMATSYSRQSAWGVEWHDRRVTSNGYSNQNNRHDQRLLATCAAVKAKGIRVWVIALSTSLTSSLSTCASAESSFTANSSSELNAAFQEIAKNVGELRITL